MRSNTTRESAGEASRDQERLTLSQAAATLPGRPHLSTLHRWRLRGVRGVRLRTELVGGRRFTTRAWLREFTRATTAASDPQTPDKTAAPTPTRERSIRAAEAELDAAGI